MNNLIALRPKATLLAFLLTSVFVFGQDRYKETFNVGKDAIVEVNTTYTDVEFVTWNKDVVEVEAYVEGDIPNSEKQEIFDDWNLDVLGNSKKVRIESNAGSFSWDLSAFEGLEELNELESLKNLQGLEALEELGNLNFDFGDFDFKFNIPEIPDYAEFPTWPFGDQQPSFRSKDGNFNFSFDNNGMRFDDEEYREDKQAYVDKLNRKYGTNVSVREVDSWLDDVDDWAEGFEKVMEDWGEEFGENMELKFGPEFEAKMEAWGEEFGKSMEKWGEKMEKDMEKWSEEFGEDMEKWGEEFGKRVEEWAEQFDDHDGNMNIRIYDGGDDDSNPKARKKIIIRMPKGTKTEINVRHGEVKMADARNLKATLNHARFTANSIDGGETLINAAYAPVNVNNWINGALYIKYVDNCFINNVDVIQLDAVSSDVNINALVNDAILSGSFGNLLINKISDTFNSVDISLENTDARIELPDTAFNFYFNGRRSRLDLPGSLTLNKTNSKDRILYKGYNKSNNTNKGITINAAYSKLIIH